VDIERFVSADLLGTDSNLVGTDLRLLY